ncbi:hypothetical protein GCM10023189_08770 [Nibrella saemangeumensis]|uniref:Uncharacterized protein n=1 Tax=Nibrella saemangeumensis TaxID=1084526 RepID=A0ABP8MHW0_9BACT
MVSLSNILKVNAISSGATGLLLVSVPGVAASIFGVTTTAPFLEVGIFLLLFALFVFIVSLGKPIKTNLVKLIITLDTLWVVASAIALLFLFSVVSVWGNLIIAGVALWVALMAFLQKRALPSGQVSSNRLQNAAAMLTFLFVSSAVL